MSKLSLILTAPCAWLLLTAAAPASKEQERVGQPAGIVGNGGKGTTTKDVSASATGVNGDDERVAAGYDFLCRLQPDRAIACFTGPYIEALAAGDRPRAARLLQLIALGFRFDENHATCLDCCRLARQLDRQSLSAQVMEADTLTRMRRLPEAAAKLQPLMPLVKQNSLVARAAGSLAAARTDVEHAHEYLQTALVLNQDDWWAHEILSRLNYDNDFADHLQKGALCAPTAYEREMMLWQLELRTHRQSPNQTHLDNASKILPLEPSWRTSLGWRLAQTNDDQRAYSLMTDALRCPRFYKRAFSQYILYCAFHRRPKQAAAALDQLQKLAPDSPEVYVVAAQVASLNGNTSAAEEAWKRSLELNPCQGTGWAALAALPRYQNNSALLDDVAAKWQHWCPQDAECHIFTGGLLRHQGQWNAAQGQYDQSRRLLHYMENRKDKRRSQWLTITSGGGTCCYKLGDSSAALKSAIEFNQLKPDDSSMFVKVRPGKIVLQQLQGKAKTAAEHGLLADMLFETGQLDDCVKEYQAALALEDNIVWHNGLLKAFIDKRDWPSASKEDIIVANHAITSDIPQAVERLRKTLFH
jgi:tetratricopeptide (TPR) repeat protein